MFELYNRLGVPALRFASSAWAIVNPKWRRGLAGRETLFTELRNHYASLDATERILIHAASVGELEQAKPVIDRLASNMSKPHIHLTCFSSSGYESATGKYRTPDFISYSPLDDLRSVRQFLDIVQPTLSLFSRYDLWPNMSAELHTRNIPSVLFSATFDSKRESPFVRKLHAATYNNLSALLTVSETDAKGFERLGVTHPRIVATGDTRVDRVIYRKASVETAGRTNTQQAIQAAHEAGRLTIVCGSTWQADERLIARAVDAFRNRQQAKPLWIIVPHEPTEAHVRGLELYYGNQAIRLSGIDSGTLLESKSVVIVDSIGQLFQLYRDADIAYVGGGFSAGVHNVLEAAVWGVAVIVGPRRHRSQEIGALIQANGAFEITDAQQFIEQLVELAGEPGSQAGARGEEFIRSHTGATERILSEIESVRIRSSRS